LLPLWKEVPQVPEILLSPSLSLIPIAEGVSDLLFESGGETMELGVAALLDAILNGEPTCATTLNDVFDDLSCILTSACKLPLSCRIISREFKPPPLSSPLCLCEQTTSAKRCGCLSESLKTSLRPSSWSWEMMGAVIARILLLELSLTLFFLLFALPPVCPIISAFLVHHITILFRKQWMGPSRLLNAL